MVQIIPFELEHAADVVEVILSIQRDEFDIPISLEAQPDLQDIARFYQHGNGNFWVALEGKRVVGTVALLDIGHDQVALRKMFVSAAYRGVAFGVASRLLAVLLDWCGNRRIRSIYLGTTAKFLAAHRFYEKNGFAEVARSELPLAFPVMAVDVKFYRRLLGSFP